MHSLQKLKKRKEIMQNNTENNLVTVEVEERRFELQQRQMKPFMGTAMIPAHLRDMGSLMILDQVAKKFKMDLLFLAQEMYIVKGKFAISGKMAIAMINKSGVLDRRLKFEVRSQPFGVRAWGEIDGDVVHGMWIDDALIKANNWERNPLWIQQKELMARYRSATYFARMEMPDILMGFHTDDEINDMQVQEKDAPQITGAINKVAVEEVATEAVVEEIEETTPSAINSVAVGKVVDDSIPQKCTIDPAPESEEDQSVAKDPAPIKPKRASKAVTVHYPEMERMGIKRGHLANLVRYFNLDETNIDSFMADKYTFMDEFYAHHTDIQPNPEQPLEDLENAEEKQKQKIEGGGTIVATSSTINGSVQDASGSSEKDPRSDESPESYKGEFDTKEVVDAYKTPSDVAVQYGQMLIAGVKRKDLIRFCAYYNLTANSIESFMKVIKIKIDEFYANDQEQGA